MCEYSTRGSMKLAVYALLCAWFVALVLVILLTAKARAWEWDPVSQAAWLAYQNTEIVTADGVLDCDDHAKVAARHLKQSGLRPLWSFCARNGNPHVYIEVRHEGRLLALDNSSPYPVAPEEVGCD